MNKWVQIELRDELHKGNKCYQMYNPEYVEGLEARIAELELKVRRKYYRGMPKEVRKDIENKDKTIATLREALEFYANKEVEATAGMEFNGTEYNGEFGDVARTALKEAFGEEYETK